MSEVVAGTGWVGLWDGSTQATVAHVLLTFRLHRTEDGRWAAECVELGVPTMGTTMDEAMARVEEATLLYLNTIEQLGDRERVFAEQGIELRHGEPTDDAAPVRAHLNDVVSPRPVALLACG